MKNDEQAVPEARSVFDADPRGAPEPTPVRTRSRSHQRRPCGDGARFDVCPREQSFTLSAFLDLCAAPAGGGRVQGVCL